MPDGHMLDDLLRNSRYKDKDAVLAAVAQNGSALGYADESLWEDEELLAAGGQAARDED